MHPYLVFNTIALTVVAIHQQLQTNPVHAAYPLTFKKYNFNQCALQVPRNQTAAVLTQLMLPPSNLTITAAVLAISTTFLIHI